MEQEYYNSEYLSELLESPKTSDFYFRQEQLKVFYLILLIKQAI